MKTLNKVQAARALGISPRTLATRMKLGTVQYTKLEGAKIGEQSVSFTYQQLGLVEPVAAPTPFVLVHDVAIAPEYEGTKPDRFTHYLTKIRKPSEVDAKADEDRDFAEAHREGRVTDSMGNKIDGTNERWPNRGSVSVLGPVEIDHGPPAETQSHMVQGLIGTNDSTGAPTETPRHAFERNPAGFTRGGNSLAAGFSQEAYDAAMKDWTRCGGGRSEGDQEIASRQAAQNIRNSFPRG